MNIAVFIKKTTFHQGYAGFETQNKQLCEGFVKSGHTVTVFSPKLNLKIDNAELEGVKYIFVPCEFRYLLSSSKNSWINKSYVYFEKFHNENKFDLVIGQSSGALGIIKNKAIHGVKIISIAHGTIISELKSRYRNIESFKSLIMLIPDTAYALVNFFTRQRDFVHGSDKIVAVSNYVKNALIDETYAPAEKFVVIHNGVDISKFVNLSKDEPTNENVDSESKNDFRILFVGRILKEKGINEIVKLFSGGRFGNVYLDILGDGPLLSKLSKKVKTLGLDKKIIFHGKKDFNEVLKYYMNKDTKMFLFPTRRFEGFPMVIVEAMICGLPIVAFDLGGVRDAVVNESTGYLVPDGDIEQFATKVQYLIDNNIQRKEFGLNAYKIANSEFTVDAMITKYKEIINKELS